MVSKHDEQDQEEEEEEDDPADIAALCEGIRTKKYEECQIKKKHVSKQTSWVCSPIYQSKFLQTSMIHNELILR